MSRWDETVVDLVNAGDAYGIIHVKGDRVKIRNDVGWHTVDVGWEALCSAVEVAKVKLDMQAKAAGKEPAVRLGGEDA